MITDRLFAFHDEFPLICGVFIILQLFVIDDDGVGLFITDEFNCPLDEL
jgi:hypothetical protein